MNSWKKISSKLAILFASATLLVAALWTVGPAEVLRDLGQFPVWSIAIISGIFTLNLFVVSLRLSRILAHFGLALPPGIASRASITGHLAGLFVMSIFGQVFGRHMVLQRFGVSSVLIATLTVYERVILVLVGGGLCLAGAFYVIDRTMIVDFLTELSVIEIVFTCVVGLVLSQWIGRSRFEKQLAVKFISFKNGLNFFEVSIITLMAQVLVLMSFVVGVLSLNPQVDLLSVFAAAAIISFAASMPVTVNGWGVRELTAVYVLGNLGISSSNALAVSILVGLCSTVVILVMAPWALKKTSAATPTTLDKMPINDMSVLATSKNDLEKAAVWLVSIAAGILVFFQVHVVLPNGTVNLNLADPFAIIALATVLGQVFVIRKMPRWGIKGFNWALAMISALLVFAFVRGVQEVGITQWALASRLVGWLVLLGYLCIGYLLVSFIGKHGLRRFAETMISTAVVVVVVDVIARWLHYTGYDLFHITANFEGYAGNRNAFAFQLIISSALILTYSSLHNRLDRQSLQMTARTEGSVVPGRRGGMLGLIGPRRLLFSVLHGVVLVGIIFTGSLGGLITGIALLVIAWTLRLADRRLIELSILAALVMWKAPRLIFWLKPYVYQLMQWPYEADGGGVMEALIRTHLSGDASHAVRWQTIIRGLELWQQSPLFGAGLGVFIEQSPQWIGVPTVIHSTPVWMLSEFGLVGVAIFGWALYVLIRSLHRGGTVLPAHRIILFVLIGFSLFSLVHEVFFQRIFWLVLGAAAGACVSIPRVRKQGTQAVFHIITSLNAGGAERMLTRLVSTPSAEGVKHSVVSLMDEGVFGPEIKGKGVPLHTLGMMQGVPSVRALWRLLQLLRREKPDVLMSWLYHADLMAFIAGGLLGIRRKYWNLRCSDMTQANRTVKSRMIMWLLVHLSPYTAGVVVNSLAGMLHHQSLGYRPKKWHVISNGVNLDKFTQIPGVRQALQEELSIPNDALLIGHVARLHPMKDYGTLLAAAAIVVESNPRVHFVLMGKDVRPKTPFFAEHLEHSALKGQVHLLGGQRDVVNILSGLDLFVLSSSYGEGAPNVVIEAMASRIPCVVTDVGDAGLIVGDTGRVVPTQDPIALAEALSEQLALSEAERKALGNRARARVEENYDINTVIAQYQTLFLQDISE